MGLCPCVVSVVLWSALVCECRGILCGCGCCRDRDACSVCVVCLLIECDGARLTAMLVCGCFCGMSTLIMINSGTRGSGIVSSAAGVLWMSVCFGCGGVGGVGVSRVFGPRSGGVGWCLDYL